MAVDVTAAPTGARTGEQYLAGQRDEERGLDGRRADRRRRRPPAPRRCGARSRRLVRLVPRARRRPACTTSPTTGLARQRVVRAAALARGSRATPHRPPPHVGVPRRRHAPCPRLPQRHLRALRCALRRVGPPRQRAGRREPRPLLRADARARPLDDARDHESAGRPLAARRGGGRRRDRVAQGRRVAEGIVVRGARMLATLAPYADEISIYPGSRCGPRTRPMRSASHCR